MSDHSKVRKVKPVPLFLDNPVDADTLGVEQLAYTIAGAAIGNPGPLTIGVFGGWGQGKTSVLKISRKLLQNKETWEHPVATVWFNAWQHEREEHPLLSLIAAIVDGLERESNELSAEDNHSVQFKAKEGYRKAALSLRALTRGMKFSGKVGVPLVGEVAVEFDASKALAVEEKLGEKCNPLIGELLYHNAFETLVEVSQNFQEELSQVNSGVHANVVVFIDDLDRCDPARALYLLEGIKLILSQPGFVFIMGIDRNIIESYLEYIYEKKFNATGGERGRRYLDKIIQMPVHLANAKDVMRHHFNELIKGFNERCELLNEDLDTGNILSNCLETLIKCSKGNPRNLVRLLNGLLFDFEMFRQDPDNFVQDSSASLIFYRLLQLRLSPEDLEQIIDSETFWNNVSEESLNSTITAADDKRAAPMYEIRCASILINSPDLLELLQRDAKNFNHRSLRKRIHQAFRRVRRSDLDVAIGETIKGIVRSTLGFGPKQEILISDYGRVLNLNLGIFSNLQVAEVIEALRLMPDLHTLHLNGSVARDEILEVIGRYCKKVERLSLTNGELSQNAILKLIEGCKNISSLNINGTRSDDYYLQVVLKFAPMLSELYCENSSNIAEGFRNVLSGDLRLRDISVAGNPIDDDDLITIVSRCPLLTSLNIADTKVSAVGLIAASPKMSQLENLVIRKVKNLDEWIRELIDKRIALDNLSAIDADSFSISDKCAEEIAEWLPNVELRR